MWAELGVYRVEFVEVKILPLHSERNSLCCIFVTFKSYSKHKMKGNKVCPHPKITAEVDIFNGNPDWRMCYMHFEINMDPTNNTDTYLFHLI